MLKELSRTELYKFILDTRILISRMGESDRFKWWEVEAQSQGGQFALKRIFPKTYQWVGLEISMKSAKAKINGLLEDNGNVIHIFKLTYEIDSAINAVFVNSKRANKKIDDFSFEFNNARNSIIEYMNENYLDSIDRSSIEVKESELVKITKLGELKRDFFDDIRNIQKVIEEFVAYFALGDMSHLFIPYYDLIE